MSDLAKRIADLSPEKRALFELRLKKRRMDTLEKRVVSSIQPVARDGALPPSFAQERLWFLDQLEPGSSAYNIPAAFRLKGVLDRTALEQSLNEIVRRHEVLRTTFATVGGQPVQVIASDLNLALPIVDLCKFPEAKREIEVQRLVTEEAQRPFDLIQDPFLRTTLLHLDDEEHVLLLTMHHIVSDGWSMGVFNQELAALYKAFSARKPSPLPELPIQYADFAHWQRQWLQGEVLEAQLAYWKQQLGGSLPVLKLPTDRPRPAIQTFQGATQSFMLSATLTESLNALSHQEGVTLFMTLLAAFKTLLYRYTSQEDILLGSPAANRNRVEIEGLIGFFVNTLVLRTDLSGDPTFQELLGRVRAVTLGAYAHQGLPFERLVEELQPERDLSHNPLFQVMFALQDVLMVSAPALTGLSVSLLEPDSGAAKFDLTLFVEETGQRLRGLLEYNTDLFSATTITRLAGHFQSLLRGIVVHAKWKISELPLLTEAEHHRLLVEWNDTGTDYPRHRCIQEFFEAQVERTPDTVALVFEEEHLSYAELNRRANQLAHHLRGLGVGPETLVGVCAERSLEMVVGLYGALKAGGAYAPLDPTYPRERLAFMLADAQAAVLLTQKRLLPTLPAHEAQVVCLDADWETVGQQSIQNPVSGVVDDGLAYVIYTSGSTGRPKGAMNTHRGIRNRLLWMQEAYQLVQADRVMQKTPFSFDVSVWEFFWPLLTGACLVVARPEGHKDSAYLVEVVVEQKVTTVHFVPSMLQVFVEERKVGACRSLKRVICSGEALPFDLQERFFARLDAELHNLYGPTEAAVDVTFWPCGREGKRQVVPIGRPIANVQVYLLDARLESVPVGVPGELHIGGVGLARGYLNRSSLTAEKFIPHPFSSDLGARLYRTGDLARYLPDGNIEFIGRIDHQVKVRGFRIELGEIEVVLRQHPGVRETIILTQGDDPGQKRLVAYVVPNREPALAASELRNFLRAKLPDYMVPSTFVMLDALPLMPNGKVDRRALLTLKESGPEPKKTFAAPRTSVEKKLAAIWGQLLGVEQVGIHDDFFEQGGHSLLAVRLVSRVRSAFHLELPIRSLFQVPTVAGLAQVIENTRDSGGGPQAPAIVPLSREKHRVQMSSSGELTLPEALLHGKRREEKE
jgi:amino acid adenylation domain-containing protein